MMNGSVVLLGAAWFTTRLPGIATPDSTHLPGDGHYSGRELANRGRGNSAMSDEKSGLKLDARRTAIVVIDLQRALRECPVVRRTPRPP